MPSAKSRVACRATAREFIEQNRAASGRAYFWTFTFTLRHDREMAEACWHTFWQRVGRCWPQMKGLKVIQDHPGGHGAHFHVLLDRYLPMGVLLRMGEDLGFGHMWVQRVKGGDIALAKVVEYVSKYISRRADVAWAGARMWARFGAWMSTRCVDISIDCVATRALREFRLIHGVRGRLRYDWCCQIVRLANLWGEYRDWPEMARGKLLGAMGYGILAPNPQYLPERIIPF